MFLESFKKDSAGKCWLKEDQQYFYRTQQHHFTVERKYCDFLCVGVAVGVVPQHFSPENYGRVATLEFCFAQACQVLVNLHLP